MMSNDFLSVNKLNQGVITENGENSTLRNFVEF